MILAVALSLAGMNTACDKLAAPEPEPGQLASAATQPATSQPATVPANMPSYVFKLPDSTDVSEVQALRITAQVEDAPSGEGFLVRAFAIPDEKTNQSAVPLGQHAVFKPPAEKSKLNMVFAAPPPEAWIHQDGHLELHVTLSVEPGNPQRPQPKVVLGIDKVDASIKR